MLPVVALVGRPNVGKSTLFNVLTRSRDALVHDQPGVTRDRNYGVCRLDPERPFLLVDTGGIAGEEEGLAGATARQARAAAEEADLVLFVVDGREGPAGLDDELVEWLRRGGWDNPQLLPQQLYKFRIGIPLQMGHIFNVDVNAIQVVDFHRLGNLPGQGTTICQGLLSQCAVPVVA